MDRSGESNDEADLQTDSPDLILQARRGDVAAWEVLVRQHQEAIFRLAYLFLGDSAEAEDTAQETFLRAYQALHRFDGSRPLRPWLLSIAANLARNRLRSARRFLKAVQRLIRLEPEQSYTRDHVQEAHWQSQSVWRAIQKLGTNDQQIVYLRYYLGLSVEEAAQTLGVASGTIKSRLNRALGRLRSVIERDVPELKDYST
jgi:RNA polymerase sigma-70 factor (ECF subfamily)